MSINQLRPEHLVLFAEKCGHDAQIVSGDTVMPNPPKDYEAVVLNHNLQWWHPETNLTQNHLLMQKVLMDGDCELLTDDGEYFVYQFDVDTDKELLSHGEKLHTVIIEAALAIWFPDN